jgi:hypothetical protein
MEGTAGSCETNRETSIPKKYCIHSLCKENEKEKDGEISSSSTVGIGTGYCKLNP